MNIALINQPWGDPIPPVEKSSIGIVTYQLALRLAQAHDVVVYGHARGRRREEEVYAGIRFIRVPLGNDLRWKWLLRRRPLRQCLSPSSPYFSSPWFYGNYTNRVARELRNQNRHIVHLHNFSQMIPVIRRHNPRARIVLHMHCEWLTQLDRAMIACRLAQTDLILGCSHYITKGIQSSHPDVASRCRTIFNGVDINLFGDGRRSAPPRADAGPLLLFVGRVSPEKGVHVLLEAFRQVLPHYPRARLSIVGGEASMPREYMIDLSRDPRVAQLSKYYHANYHRHLRSLILPDALDQITFAGAVLHQTLPGLFRQADMLVLPSIGEEAFGMPLVEAMATGTPVIATRVGGMPEIVKHGVTGLLVEPADSDSLANAILHLLNKPRLRESMEKAARARAARRFSWERVSRDLVNAYETIL